LTKHGTGSKVRSFRASPAEWEEWQRLADADGIALNKWLRRAANTEAEQERMLAAMEARERQADVNRAGRLSIGESWS
jgi:hypothetical protein